MIRKKVYAAYKAAVTHEGQPTVILAKTIKGYGLGESGEGKNITHQQKKLNEDELADPRDQELDVGGIECSPGLRYAGGRGRRVQSPTGARASVAPGRLGGDQQKP